MIESYITTPLLPFVDAGHVFRSEFNPSRFYRPFTAVTLTGGSIVFPNPPNTRSGLQLGPTKSGQITA